MIRKDSPFLKCNSESYIKEICFKYMHIFKAMSTLSDYFDLNRRYFNLTQTIIFDDQRVKFDIIPKYFFEECIENIYKESFEKNKHLTQAIEIEEISRSLIFDTKKIYRRISDEMGIEIKSPKQAIKFIKDERYRRFNQLIDKRFKNSILNELLKCFESRNDSRIEELVTAEADIPTVFEYIIAIIWYKISERKGNILDYMKLSLEANLLPKTHATGGYADIVYEYNECKEFLEHSLLIEATLSESTNQRRMEMEPVSRHLGDYILKSGNSFDYSIFISTFLHRNVISDFRHRKSMQYFGAEEQQINGMKIIPIDTNALKQLLNSGSTYRELYEIIDKYHKKDLKLPQWHEELIKEIAKEYI